MHTKYNEVNDFKYFLHYFEVSAENKSLFKLLNYDDSETNIKFVFKRFSL